jgi:sialate O-acetylesterase
MNPLRPVFSGGRHVSKIFLLTIATGLLATAPVRADVTLPALFTDHMVMQRGMEVPVWGWADNGEEVTVQFAGQTKKAKAQDGKWMVKLAPLKASADGATLTVKGANMIEVNDVVVGEVWIASGQSNMEWPMSRSANAEKDIAEANSKTLRLFHVPKSKKDAPVSDVDAKWTYSNPDTVKGFSAVAYYFGRDVEKALGVPVGLIHTSWGGSPAEVWMSDDVLAANAGYQADIVESYRSNLENFQRANELYQKEKREAEGNGAEFTKQAPRGPGWKPSELYNGMIAPLIPYAFKGAIWYQGESNAGRAHQYRTLFPDMIKKWRRDWGQGDFPFLFVQLAPWDKNRKRELAEIAAETVESDWAELREAQSLTLEVLPNTGMAVITDLGDKDDIHPTQKEPVGARLALAAETDAYGNKDKNTSGPTYRSVKFENANATDSL